MKFRALERFYSPETKSTYVKDLLYTIRPGNDLLAVLVKDWVDEGKAEYVDNIVDPTSHISGQGKVT